MQISILKIKQKNLHNKHFNIKKVKIMVELLTEANLVVIWSLK